MSQNFQQSQLQTLELLGNTNVSHTVNPSMSIRTNSMNTSSHFNTSIKPLRGSVDTVSALKNIAINQGIQTTELVTSLTNGTNTIASVTKTATEASAKSIVDSSKSLQQTTENSLFLYINELKKQTTLHISELAAQTKYTKALFTANTNRLKELQFAAGRGSEFRFLSKRSKSVGAPISTTLAFSKPVNRIINPTMTDSEKQTALLSGLYTIARFSGQELVSIRNKQTINKFDEVNLMSDSITQRIVDKLETTKYIAPIIEVGRLLSKVSDVLISPIDSFKQFLSKVFPSRLTTGADLAAKAGFGINEEKSAYHFLATSLPDLSHETVTILNKQLGVQENIQAILEDILTATTGQTTRRVNQRDILESKVYDPILGQYVTKVESKKISEERVKQAYNIRRRERGLFSRLVGIGKNQDLQAAKESNQNDYTKTAKNNFTSAASDYVTSPDNNIINSAGKIASVAAGVALGPLGLLAGLLGTKHLLIKNKSKPVIDETRFLDFSQKQPIQFGSSVTDNYTGTTSEVAKVSKPKWQEVIEVELPEQTRLLRGGNLAVKSSKEQLSSATLSALPYNPATDQTPNDLQSIDARLQSKDSKSSSIINILDNQTKLLSKLNNDLVGGENNDVVNSKHHRRKKDSFLLGLLGSGIGKLTNIISSSIAGIGTIIAGTIFGGTILTIIKSSITSLIGFLWKNIKSVLKDSVSFLWKHLTGLVKNVFTSVLGFIKNIPILGSAVKGIETLISKISKSSIASKIAKIGSRFAAREGAALAVNVVPGAGQVASAALTAANVGMIAYDIYDMFFSDDSSTTLSEQSKKDSIKASKLLEEDPTSKEGLLLQKKSRYMETAATIKALKDAGNIDAAKAMQDQFNRMISKEPHLLDNISHKSTSISKPINKPHSNASQIKHPIFDTAKSYASNAIDFVKNKTSSIADNVKDYFHPISAPHRPIINNSSTPRGVRNNNPGNLRSNIPWKGMIGSDSSGFAIFDTPENGIKAAAKNLKTYFNKHHLNSVHDIISRWAPSNENDTQSYIKSVASQLGVSANEPLDITSSMPGLLASIFRHENGADFYPMNMIKNISDSVTSQANRALNSAKSIISTIPSMYNKAEQTVSTAYETGRSKASDIYTNTATTIQDTVKHVDIASIESNSKTAIHNGISELKSHLPDIEKMITELNNTMIQSQKHMNDTLSTIAALLSASTQSQQQSSPTISMTAPNESFDNKSMLDEIINRMFTTIPLSISNQSIRFAGLSQEVFSDV